MAKPSKTEAVNFETAMERLENIVFEMESSQLPLDELLNKYEEGTRLIQHCQQKLQAAEQRIEMVNRKPVDLPPENSPAPFPTIESLPSDDDISLF